MKWFEHLCITSFDDQIAYWNHVFTKNEVFLKVGSVFGEKVVNSCQVLKKPICSEVLDYIMS